MTIISPRYNICQFVSNHMHGEVDLFFIQNVYCVLN